MFRGERGKTGDHGQEGPRGPAGSSDPDDFERHVAAVTAQSLAAHEKQLRWTDRRIAAAALFLVFAVCLAFFIDDRNDDRFAREQREADHRITQLTNELVMVCNENVEGHIRQNQTLERLAQNALSNPVRTEAEREQIAEDYEGLKQPISQCPPLR